MNRPSFKTFLGVLWKWLVIHVPAMISFNFDTKVDRAFKILVWSAVCVPKFVLCFFTYLIK